MKLPIYNGNNCSLLCPDLKRNASGFSEVFLCVHGEVMIYGEGWVLGLDYNLRINRNVICRQGMRW